jgi:hypothetical protein
MIPKIADFSDKIMRANKCLERNHDSICSDFALAQLSLAGIDETCLSSCVRDRPAEIDFRLHDLPGANRQYLAVAEAPSGLDLALIGDEDPLG